MRRYFTARCNALHLTLLIVLPAFALLTKWQLDRALGGNTLSWAYTFEWPLFAGYAVYVWFQLVRDNARGAGAGPRANVAVDGPLLAEADADPDGVGRRVHGGPAGVGERSAPEHLEPGWALTGGRERNVAIAASTAVDGRRLRGERYAEQTPEEAERLAAYNRYLAELAAADEASSRRR